MILLNLSHLTNYYSNLIIIILLFFSLFTVFFFSCHFYLTLMQIIYAFMSHLPKPYSWLAGTSADGSTISTVKNISFTCVFASYYYAISSNCTSLPRSCFLCLLLNYEFCVLIKVGCFGCPNGHQSMFLSNLTMGEGYVKYR